LIYNYDECVITIGCNNGEGWGHYSGLFRRLAIPIKTTDDDATIDDETELLHILQRLREWYNINQSSSLRYVRSIPVE